MPQIPAYPAKTVPDDGDLLIINDSVAGNTKNITREDFLSGAPLPDDTVTTDSIQDGAVAPEKRNGGFFIGTIPAATFGTTGNKVITGVGFMPKLVRFTVLPVDNTTASTTGMGAMSSSGQFATATASIGGTTLARTSVTTAAILWIGATGTSSLVASYVSMDADGFTVNVTTASGTFAVAYEAYA